LLALVSGVALALAWPAIGDLTPFVFFALIPLFIIEDHYYRGREVLSSRGMLKYLYLAFVIWNVLTTWWISCVSESLTTKIFASSTAILCNSMFMVIPWYLFHLTRKKVGSKEGYFGLVFYWISFEYLHMQWDLSWPWLTLGNIFANNVEWVQWYDHSGVFGGTLWVLCVNILAFKVINTSWKIRKIPKAITAILLIVLLVPILTSKIKYSNYAEEKEPVEVVIVQPNIDPYNEKFDGLTPEEQLERMLDLAEEKISPKTKFVLFPETALQEMSNVYLDRNGELGIRGLWENDLEASRSVIRIREWLKQYDHVKIITGMASAYLYGEDDEFPPTARPLKPSGHHFESYNAAMQLGADGNILVHHKSKLVVGVELMPFAGLLSGLDAIAIDLGGISGSLGRQDTRNNFDSPEWELSVTPAICYESIYGEYIAEYVKNGSQLLFIITNDGWWQDTPGYKQHLAYGRLRAIEHRRSIARCANTGISCFIDQRGDVHQKTEWWVPATLSGELNANDHFTFYTRHGDQIARASIFFAALLLLFTLVKHIRNRT